MLRARKRRRKESDNEKNDSVYLPQELWLHIFAFVTPKDILQHVMLVSKEWLSFAKDNLLWKVLSHEAGLPPPTSMSAGGVIDWSYHFRSRRTYNHFY